MKKTIIIKWRLTKFPLWRFIFWKKIQDTESHIEYEWRHLFIRRKNEKSE